VGVWWARRIWREDEDAVHGYGRHKRVKLVSMLGYRGDHFIEDGINAGVVQSMRQVESIVMWSGGIHW